MSALLFGRLNYNRKKLPKNAERGLHREERRPALEIIQDLKDYHKSLVGLFGSEVGHDLFFQESQGMTEILLRINSLGIVDLPVHDAIYVPSNRVAETREIMEQAFSELVGMEGIIRTTLPPSLDKPGWES